ncbi:flagellar assembly protein FliW [Anaeroselena agilis]|uniref:Flagellar assembly factor FliW n=1 Tax=Anaeroselena agilis TaxID=3063788 RepID=A0ABU3P4C6_9FIRM|nr:flagellar assembly protein FliW [Selenomonadales bacterium 4137-cl]
MVIESIRFGSLEVDEHDIIRFPQGLLGFGEEKAFVFLPHGQDSPFAFLQSVSQPELTFFIADPFQFFADYEFELDDDLAGQIGLTADCPLQVFCIVTVADKLEEMTANLLAPVVVNWRERSAVQAVLDRKGYTTRHRLFPDGFPTKPKEGK